LAEEGRLGSHRSVLLNGLGTAGLFDEDEAAASDEFAGFGVAATVGLGVGLALVAARFIAAMATAADGLDCPGRKPPSDTAGSLFVSLETGGGGVGDGDGLDTEVVERAAQECCCGNRCSGQNSLRQLYK
jgi:hypothetical protein